MNSASSSKNLRKREESNMADQDSMTTVTTDTIVDVAQDKAVRKVLRDMFADIQPRLGEEKTDLVEIFTPESAADLLQRLTDFTAMLSVEDSYQETLNKFQAQIDKAEKIRDEVLGKLYQTIKPIETSYRQIWLFFENSEVPDGKK